MAALASAAEPPSRVPVTIVTGALGAGKSTLLQYILTERHGQRIAVIENEFAETGGIESLVLKNGVGGDIADGFFELANGCVCCSVRDGLVRTLQTVMRHRDKFDYILIETSGLADPGPVASIFWTDVDEDATLSLDAIVVVVDAAHVTSQLHRRRAPGTVNEVERQVALADVVLLNKVDMVDATALEQVKATVHTLNPSAVLEPCSFSRVPLAAILNVGAYDADRISARRLVVEADHPCDACTHPGDCHDATHMHDSAIAHAVIRLRGNFSLSKLQMWLADVLWKDTIQPLDEEEPPLLAEDVTAHASPTVEHATAPTAATGKILRMKGVLWAIDDRLESITTAAKPYVLQAVLEQFDLQPLRSGLEEDIASHLGSTTSTLIVIGEHVSQAEVEAALGACILPEGPP